VTLSKSCQKTLRFQIFLLKHHQNYCFSSPPIARSVCSTLQYMYLIFFLFFFICCFFYTNSWLCLLHLQPPGEVIG
jgi:hypothetical protein